MNTFTKISLVLLVGGSIASSRADVYWDTGLHTRSTAPVSVNDSGSSLAIAEAMKSVPGTVQEGSLVGTVTLSNFDATSFVALFQTSKTPADRPNVTRAFSLLTELNQLRFSAPDDVTQLSRLTRLVE